VMITGGNRYVVCNAKLRNICNLFECDEIVGNELSVEFSALLSKYHTKVMRKSMDVHNDNSEFVSCNPPIDTDRSCKRKKSSTEPKISKSSRRKKAPRNTTGTDLDSSFVMEI
jgi:hypothetical protein